LIALAACFAVVATAALAEAASSAPDTVPQPGGAATGASAYDQLTSTACPAAGDCVAVGAYKDPSGVYHGLIETESGGTWTASAPDLSHLAGVTANAASNLTSVACTAVGGCVAVGWYRDSAGHYQGLIDTETKGIWVAREAALTGLGSVDSNPGIYFFSVSCASAGYCAAVGWYHDSSDVQQGLIETESGGTWVAREANLAGLNAYSNPQVIFQQVSCPSAGNCAAVGTYFNVSTGNYQGLIETESGGTWTARQADTSGLPGNVRAESVELDSVSCPSAGSCSAIGTYGQGSGLLLLRQVGSAWQPATAATLPTGNATSTAVSGTSVSCASAGNCTAVGGYAGRGLELTETNGSWGAAAQTSLPTPAASNPQAWLTSVSCQSAGNCTAVGTYERSDNGTEVVIATQSDGKWSTAGTELATSFGNYVDNLGSISCTPGGYCAAAGYVTVGATAVGFLLDPTPTSGTGTTTTPTSGTGTTTTPTSGTGTTTTPTSGAGTTTTPTRTTTTTPATTPSSTPPPPSSTPPPPAASITGAAENLRPQLAPSDRQISSTLNALLAPQELRNLLGGLRRSHIPALTYGSLEPGRVLITLSELTGHGRHGRERLVASGYKQVTGAQTARLILELTAVGKSLVAIGKPMNLNATVSFTPTGQTAIARSRVFTLRV
jgi:hypothetical protein